MEKKDSRNEMEVVCQQPLIYLVCSCAYEKVCIIKKTQMRTRNESLGSVFDGVFFTSISYFLSYIQIVWIEDKKKCDEELAFTHRHVTYACG